MVSLAKIISKLSMCNYNIHISLFIFVDEKNAFQSSVKLCLKNEILKLNLNSFEMYIKS